MAQISKNGNIAISANNTLGTSNYNQYLYSISSVDDRCSTISSVYSVDTKNLLNHLFRTDATENTIRAVLADNALNKDVPFDDLLENRTFISERFLAEFYNSFTQYKIYKYQEVSIEFIKLHAPSIFKDEAAINAVSCKCNLTPEFIEEYKDQLNWDALMSNEKIQFTKDFLIQNANRLSETGFTNLIKNDHLESGIFNAFIMELSPDITTNLDWRAISWNKELTEEIIETYLDYIDFNSLLLATRKFKSDVITCFRRLKFGF